MRRLQVLTDPVKFNAFLKENKKEILLWVGIFIFFSFIFSKAFIGIIQSVLKRNQQMKRDRYLEAIILKTKRRFEFKPKIFHFFNQGGFFVGILLIYFLFSDGDFSFFFTLSGAVQMFGFFLILLRINMSKSCSGISLQTIYFYVLIFFFRLISILLFDG